MTLADRAAEQLLRGVARAAAGAGECVSGSTPSCWGGGGGDGNMRPWERGRAG